ncbi:MAG: hypothetical protein ABIH46_11220 [Chloroflexota bacterium]
MPEGDLSLATLISELEQALHSRSARGPLQLNAWTELCPATLLMWVWRWAAGPGEGIMRATNEAWLREVISSIQLGGKTRD